MTTGRKQPEEGERVKYMSPDGGIYEARIERVHASSGERAEVNLRYGHQARLAENVPYSGKPALGTWGRPSVWGKHQPAKEDTHPEDENGQR